MSLTINNLNADFQFAKAKGLIMQMIQKQGINASNFDDTLLTQHTLRSEVSLSATATQFHVPVLANDPLATTTFNTENRLSLQDLFVPSEIGIFVAKPASATDTNFDLFTYGDLTTFNASNTAASIKGLYNNAYLRYTNNQRVVIPYWDLKRHYNAPITQTAANAGYTSSGVNLTNSVNGSVDGFYPLNPGVVFNGAGNIDVNIFVRNNLTAVETNSRIVVLWRGILLQNASSIK